MESKFLKFTLFSTLIERFAKNMRIIFLKLGDSFQFYLMYLSAPICSGKLSGLFLRNTYVLRDRR